MAALRAPKTYDGVGALECGDTLVIVYQAPAKLHRTRWVFDRADDLAARCPDGIRALLIVLPTADPPDGPTRVENAARLKRLGASLRCLVTVPLGDSFWMAIVRTVMRAMIIVGPRTCVQFVAPTVSEGIAHLRENPSPKMPSRTELEGAVRDIHAALGVSEFRMTGT